MGLVSIFTHTWAQDIQTLEIQNPLNYLEFLGASKVFLLLSPHQAFSYLLIKMWEKKLQLRVQGGICDSLYSEKAKAVIHEGLLRMQKHNFYMREM